MGFDTLARTGKWLSLVVDDVMVDGQSGFAGALRFRETETGQREGIHQSAAIENAVVRGALRYLCRDLEPGKQLLEITDFKSRQVWAHVVASLKLQEFSLRPYSMRRKGATWEWEAPPRRTASRTETVGLRCQRAAATSRTRHQRWQICARLTGIKRSSSPSMHAFDNRLQLSSHLTRIQKIKLDVQRFRALAPSNRLCLFVSLNNRVILL